MADACYLQGRNVLPSMYSLWNNKEGIVVPNLLTSIAGDPKSGKSSLGLTFPEPIIVLSFDLRGAELLLPKFPNKEIEIKKFLPPLIVNAEADKESFDLWKQIDAEFRRATEGGHYNTIIYDPATMLWEIVRSAYEYERAKGKLLRRDYGIPNSRMAGMLMQPIAIGMNVVSVNYLGDVYEGNEATGEKKLDGFKRTDGLADFLLLTEMKKNPNKTSEKKCVVKTTVEKCRFDSNLNGQEIEDATYDDIITLLGVE